MENINEYKHLCKYCFDVLLNTLNNKKELVPFPEKFKSVKYFNFSINIHYS